MFDRILTDLSNEDKELFKAFFVQPVFMAVIRESLLLLQDQIWKLDISDTENWIINYERLQREYSFWNGFKNLIENVEGTTDAPQIEILDE